MQKEELLAELKKEFPDHHAEIAKSIKRHIRIEHQVEDTPTLGASRFCAYADAEEGFAWPHHDKGAYMLMAQINLAELPENDWLPDAGLLLIFISDVEVYYTGNLDTHVHYVPAGVPLQQYKQPEHPYCEDTYAHEKWTRLNFTSGYDIHPHYFSDHKPKGWEDERLWQAQDRLIALGEKSGGADKLFGNEIRGACAMDYADTLKDADSEALLVMQLNHQCEADGDPLSLLWHCFGYRLKIYMPKSDLAGMDFSRLLATAD